MEPTADAPRDLTANELRVLGCLIEKEATVPDSYPLTLNALRSAANQSTSREPVMTMTDHEVDAALTTLRARGLTRTVHSTSNRAAKYRHVLPDVLGLDVGATSLLSVLMLRGAQTPGELKTRTERQHAFTSSDAVEAALQDLADRDGPLVRRLDRQPGQKDARWIHLLSPYDEATGGVGAGTSTRAHREQTDRADAADPADPYGAATAEFYELLATAHWERTGLELLDLLDGVDASAGPIIDIGAGTGVGLPYLRAAVPDARIHAIEPSRAMRTALHTRLLLDPSLQGCVTVDPRPLVDAMPDTACAIVLSAVLGHLDDTDRVVLWRFVVERMPTGAPVVVELLPPHRPVVIESTRYRTVPIGRFTYEGWQEGEPVDDRSMRWTMTYRVLDRDTVIADHRVTSTYRCWSPEDVRHDIEPFGLTMTEHGDAVVVRS